MNPEALRQACKASLVSYACVMNPRYEVSPHHRLIAQKLQDVFDGKNDRLMIFAPPRHGKSELTSKIGPAWFLGKYPHRKVIAASHTLTLAEDFGSEVRDLLSDPLHEALMGTKGSLNNSTTAKGNFRTNAKGEYYAVGVGGTPIGKGADVAIIDDPIKSRKEAESPKYREDLKSWYTSSIYSRLEGQGAVILMHQRWHDDDLAGWLLEEHADENWEVLNLPALAEEDDVLGRVPGEALWWQRYDEIRLNRIQRSVGPKDFLSMYQQRPREETGDEFKEEYLLRYTKFPSEIAMGMNLYLMVDPASSKKKGSDYTVMMIVGLGTDGNYYLIDAIRERLKLSERASKLIEMHQEWRPNETGYEKYGKDSDIEHIQGVQEGINYRFHIHELGGNQLAKVERIRRLLPDLEAGKWYFPERLMKKDSEGVIYDFMEVLWNEMKAFPVGKHDDAVDDMGRIYDMPTTWPSVSTSRAGVATGGPKPW